MVDSTDEINHSQPRTPPLEGSKTKNALRRCKMVENAVEKIVGKLKEMGLIEAPNEELVKKIKMLLVEFRVPEEEVLKTMINSIKREKGIQRTTVTRIADLKKGANANLKIKVLAVFKGKGKVVQRAIAGDPTGKTVLANLTKTVLQAKKCYEIKNAYVDYDERRKKHTLMITGFTEVSEIQEDIQVAKDSFEGMVIHVLQAGFILLCPTCKKPLRMGTCPEHGKQTQPAEKLIAKFIVDSGEKAVYARIADEKLEDALKISRNDLKELLVQSLDPNAPKQLIENRLLGKHVVLKGFEGRKAFFVDEIQFLTSAELEKKTRQLLETATKIKNFTPAENKTEEQKTEDETEDEYEIEEEIINLNDLL
jgi:replication factor A1